MLIYPSDSVDEDINLEAYSSVKNQQDTGGKLFPIETDVEWGVIEEFFNQFMNKIW